MLNIKNIETEILKNWTKYICPRQIISLLRDLGVSNPQNIKLNLFEFKDSHTLVWFSFYENKKEKTIIIKFKLKEIIHLEIIN